MVLARWQSTIVDDEGNVQSSASVEVRREVAGSPLATIYSDRDGATPLGNPMTAETDGFAAFHVPGGAYKITATKGAFSREWRYVAIGLSSENDFFGAFLPRGAYSGGTTYAINDLVESGGFAYVSNEDDNVGNTPPTTGSPAEPASDTHWTYIGPVGLAGADGEPGSSDVTGSSTTSLAIGTGSKAFTVAETDRGWGVGARLRASSSANPTVDYMEGVVTSYSGTSLSITVDLVAGSGTHADWSINLAGDRGAEGEKGDQGDPGTSGADGVDAPLIVSILVFLTNENVTVSDGAGAVAYRVPQDLDGFELTEIGASIVTAGTTGNLDIQIRNVTQAVDMLSTAMRIESGETSTLTSGQPGTIDTGNSAVAAGDIIVVDVDSVQSSPPSGLIVDLKFEAA